MRPNRGVLLTIGAAVLVAGLSAVATQGLAYAGAAVVAALYLAFVVTFGARTTGIACMMAAFAFAPMYRGFENLTGGIPPTDVFVIAGIIHLLPTVIQHRLQVPTTYLVGLLLVAITSLVAVMVTGDLFTNAFYAIQWLFFIGVLPLFFAWWRPRVSTVCLLLWAYLVGHTISTAKAVVEGAAFADRYDGFTHHPNAFGLAGLATIAAVLFLLRQYENVAPRVVLLGFAALGVVSISMSGSRAAIVVLGALILLIPLVERSALMGVGLAAVGACGVLSIPFLVDVSGEESAIGRLRGGGTATGSDRIREDALADGLERFWQSPILGTGFREIELIHNVFLEAAVAIGIFGLLGYLVVLFTLARPLFSLHPMRRLSYLIWAFIGVAPTFPGLWDRTVWVPAALAGLLLVRHEMHDAPADPEVEPAHTPQEPVSPGRA
ncbi:O-antigen ligase family protein [Nocardioides antri]|uniref:O-antigen ligase family protein n=1 Tax=Nocardioides antri TaxID=2607659 RepID=A0A5B1M5V2_9ACTN|nr:O-antigen ligase family protein [Nocardioides antri]KAA1427499.1 O-antigen ligase family protein [Nocardioides antri]